MFKFSIGHQNFLMNYLWSIDHWLATVGLYYLYLYIYMFIQYNNLHLCSSLTYSVSDFPLLLFHIYFLDYLSSLFLTTRPNYRCLFHCYFPCTCQLLLSSFLYTFIPNPKQLSHITYLFLTFLFLEILFFLFLIKCIKYK